jgi:hypothetical protein
MSEFDYAAELAIDKHGLDEEWLRQPALMGKYNKAHAQATLNKNRAKDALEVAKGEMKRVGAELAVGIKESNGGSDTTVSNKVLSHPDYLKVQADYYAAMAKLTEAQYEEDLYFGAVMAFQGRKAALEELVRLYGMDYFSEPKMEGGGHNLRVQASQAATEEAIMRSQKIQELQTEPIPQAGVVVDEKPLPRRPAPKPPTPRK